jgi:DNA-binding MarR family transcriptional regulator
MDTKTAVKSDVVANLVTEVTQRCLMTRTRRISRVITSIFDNELRPHGLSSSQFSLLVLIAKMGGASRAEIGRANHQERSTSTRNLQLVLDQGWADEVTPEKGRSRPILISKAGRELLTQAAPSWRAAQVKARHLLGTEGASAIVQLSAALPLDELSG